MSARGLPGGFYERVDRERFVATEATMSPWDERLQHGGPPTALIAHVLAETYPRDELRIARIASEFLGPIPIGEMRIRSHVARPGKRIEMLEATIEVGGRDVVTTRVWRIAMQPPGSIPAGVTPDDALPPAPEQIAGVARFARFGYGRAIDWRNVHGGGGPGPAAVWGRPLVPLIVGEPLQHLEAALIIADSANGISGELPMHEWFFAPPSLSIAFVRYPRSDWVLLDARTALSDDGLGATTFRLADPDGWIASGTQALLVEKRA